MSYYIHGVPGRLRVKSPHLKSNQHVASEVERLIGEVHGVDAIDVNLRTGSLLVNYDPKRAKQDDIVGLLAGKGYFDLSKAVTNDQYIKNAASKAGEIMLSVLTAFV
jgi:copper chaperone CopZ